MGAAGAAAALGAAAAAALAAANLSDFRVEQENFRFIMDPLSCSSSFLSSPSSVPSHAGVDKTRSNRTTAVVRLLNKSNS